jgi:hypothetical protein
MKPSMLLAERSEQSIWSGLWDAVDTDARQRLGIENVLYLDASCLMTKTVPAWFFNRVIGLGLEQPVREDDIDHLIALYHGEGLPLGISLCPETQTTQITDWLIERGFSIANQWVKMVRGTSSPDDVHCDLRIEAANAGG